MMKPILSVAFQGAAIPSLMGVLSLQSGLRRAASKMIPISPQAALFAGILGTINGIGNQILDKKFAEQPSRRRVIKAVILVSSTALLLAARPHIAIATLNAWKISSISLATSPLFEIIYLKIKGKSQPQSQSETIGTSVPVTHSTVSTVASEDSNVKTETVNSSASEGESTEKKGTSTDTSSLKVDIEPDENTENIEKPEETKPAKISPKSIVQVDIAKILPVKEQEIERNRKLKYCIYKASDKVFLGFTPTELAQILDHCNIPYKLVDDQKWVTEKEGKILAKPRDDEPIKLLKEKRFEICNDGTVKVWVTRVRTLLHLLVSPANDTSFDDLSEEQMLALRKTISKVISSFKDVFGSIECMEHVVEEEIDEDTHKTAFAYEIIPSMFPKDKSDVREKIKAQVYILTHGQYEHCGIMEDKFHDLAKAIKQSIQTDLPSVNRDQKTLDWSYKEVNHAKGNQSTMLTYLDMLCKTNGDLIYAFEDIEVSNSPSSDEKANPIKGCNFCNPKVIERLRLIEGKAIDIFTVDMPMVNGNNRHFQIVPKHHLEDLMACTDEEIIEEHRAIVNLRKTARNQGIHDPSKIFRRHGLLGIVGATHIRTQVIFCDNFQTKEYLTQKGHAILKQIDIDNGKEPRNPERRPVSKEAQAAFIEAYKELAK